MRFSFARRMGAGVAALCWLAGAASAYGQVDRKEIVRQAHSSYYSLKSRGLAIFQCDLTPNWAAVLEDLHKTDPQAADRAVAKLSQLRFTVSMSTSGPAKVTHTTVAAENAKMAEGLDQVYTGMEQMITGFFDTWSPFMITSPFPDADSAYELADRSDGWILSYKDGASNVETTMGKDLLIRELKVNAPQFSSSLRPQFARSPQGFMLSGYDADYRGQSLGDNTRAQVGIAYQMVNGFQLPQKLNVSGTYRETSFKVEVVFSACQVTRQ